jgi:hypothetical protein
LRLEMVEGREGIVRDAKLLRWFRDRRGALA